jgi:hypothetical protein
VRSHDVIEATVLAATNETIDAASKNLRIMVPLATESRLPGSPLMASLTPDID